MAGAGKRRAKAARGGGAAGRPAADASADLVEGNPDCVEPQVHLKAQSSPQESEQCCPVQDMDGSSSPPGAANASPVTAAGSQDPPVAKIATSGDTSARPGNGPAPAFPHGDPALDKPRLVTDINRRLDLPADAYNLDSQVCQLSSVVERSYFQSSSFARSSSFHEDGDPPAVVI